MFSDDDYDDDDVYVALGKHENALQRKSRDSDLSADLEVHIL